MIQFALVHHLHSGALGHKLGKPWASVFCIRHEELEAQRTHYIDAFEAGGAASGRPESRHDPRRSTTYTISLHQSTLCLCNCRLRYELYLSKTFVNIFYKLVGYFSIFRLDWCGTEEYEKTIRRVDTRCTVYDVWVRRP